MQWPVAVAPDDAFKPTLEPRTTSFMQAEFLMTSYISAAPLPRALRVLLISTLLCVSTACAAWLDGSTYPETAPARTAEDTPVRFASEDLPAGTPPSETLPGSGCRNPLIDPRDGTRLVMLNSQRTVGDYQVPAGRYGVRPGEALRIECRTGHVVGIVPVR